VRVGAGHAVLGGRECGEKVVLHWFSFSRDRE
jgi:hypothetical protein